MEDKVETIFQKITFKKKTKKIAIRRKRFLRN